MKFNRKNIKKADALTEAIGGIFSENDIELLCHSSVRIIKNNIIIYIDPFHIDEHGKINLKKSKNKEKYKKLVDSEGYIKADCIFITHSHYDHFSPEDIKKILKPSTILVVTEDLLEEAIKLQKDMSKVVTVVPNKDYEVEFINLEVMAIKNRGRYTDNTSITKLKFSTTEAYNLEKKYHQKQKKWVGYIIQILDKKIYIAGDTDNVPGLENIDSDIAMLPVGGTYTMNPKEAAKLGVKLNAKLLIPMHYGEIVGNKNCGTTFAAEVMVLDICKRIKVLI